MERLEYVLEIQADQAKLEMRFMDIVTYGIDDSGFTALNEMPFQSILSIEVIKEIINGNNATKLCVKYLEGKTDKEDGSDILTFISFGEDDSEHMTYRFVECFNNWNEMMEIGMSFNVIGSFCSDIADLDCDGSVVA